MDCHLLCQIPMKIYEGASSSAHFHGTKLLQKNCRNIPDPARSPIATNEEFSWTERENFLWVKMTAFFLRISRNSEKTLTFWSTHTKIYEGYYSSIHFLMSYYQIKNVLNVPGLARRHIGQNQLHSQRELKTNFIFN